jgi:hypothetical protein
MFGVPTVVALSTLAGSDAQLSLIVNDGATEIARLVLPLVWFPVNSIVTHAFPMITPRQQDDGPMLLLDIHTATAKIPAFAGPPGRLRVVPTWTVPESMQVAPAKEDGERYCPAPVPISALIPQEVIDAQREEISRRGAPQ